MIFTIFKQEIILNLKNLNHLINQVIFFFISISIFAISFANLNDDQASKTAAICVIWFCLIFSILLHTNNFFKKDFDDGWLEQLLISGNNFSLIITSKIFANWLISCLSLIITFPIAAAILKLDGQIIYNLILIAVISSLIIKLIASLGSALILSSSNNNALLTILVLPLTIPVIIFANSALDNFDPEIFYSSLQFLSAILIFLTPILILATSAAIKFNIEN
jgi:heme exporter protein B